ncbi:hypothetical protein JCM5353_001079 [Sporobolomyces roseus]
MDEDPYFTVKREVANQLEALHFLASTYQQNPTDWTLSELKAGLSGLRPDLEELEESVAAIEEAGVSRRLGIDASEVKSRRHFVDRVTEEIKEAYRSSLRKEQGSHPLDDPEADADFEVQHQSLLLQQQDSTLTDIASTVGLLREQAKVIGQEVSEQTQFLSELDTQVDSTSSRLAKAQRKMDKFMRDNSSSPSSWLILGLILVLSILLFIILFL